MSLEIYERHELDITTEFQKKGLNHKKICDNCSNEMEKGFLSKNTSIRMKHGLCSDCKTKDNSITYAKDKSRGIIRNVNLFMN